MPRNLSTTLREALYGQESAEALICLVTITHEDLAAPLRFANNNVDIVSNGLTYIRSAFNMPPPAERDDELPVVTMTIDNVDQAITVAIRSLNTPPAIRMEFVLGSAPDVVDYGPFDFTLKDTTMDSFTVSGRLGAENVLTEAAPADSFTPSTTPGLF